MNNIIKYRPYRSHSWFVPLSLGIGIFAFLMIGYYLPTINIAVFFWFVIGSMCLLLAKTLYDSSNIIVFFECEGLRIAGGKYTNYGYVLWKDIAHVYYAKSYKGHLFLLLSPRTLTQKQVKRFVNRSAILTKLRIDSAIIIHLDAIQDVSQLKELVASKISHIDV